MYAGVCIAQQNMPIYTRVYERIKQSIFLTGKINYYLITFISLVIGSPA